MSGIDDGVVGHFRKALQTLVHLFGIRARQIRAATPVEKEGVARHQAAAGEETLTPGRVARRMNECDVDLANLQRVSGLVTDDAVSLNSGRTKNPGSLGLVDVNRNVDLFEQIGDTCDRVAHHRTSDVIGVIVGCKNPGQAHAVGFDNGEQFVDGVRGVDDDALAGAPVAEEINEVHHLRSETVTDREVPSREQLTKIEAVVVGHVDRLWRTLTYLMEQNQGTNLLVGDRLVPLTDEMRAALDGGGRLIALPDEGSVLVIPGAIRTLVDESVRRAQAAFTLLQTTDESMVDRFFLEFAAHIDDDEKFSHVLNANRADVDDALSRGRTVGRLRITEKMRSDMAEGLRAWARLPIHRLERTDVVDHGTWAVESWRSPLGVVGFVFEGRPNVFADAMGVLKTGNTVVFRIGSDAIRTARAIRDHLMLPAMQSTGLPTGCVVLIDAVEHSAGWALFGHTALSLAVARGSGAAVAQLGQVARQNGVPVSLHGTGGAWIIAGSRFDAHRLKSVIKHSLDRKVCNTLNTLVLVEESLVASLDVVASGLGDLGRPVVVHTNDQRVANALESTSCVDIRFGDVDSGHEWEWDETPEITIVTAADVLDGVRTFNESSPQFVLSVVSSDQTETESAWQSSNAAFFGDGFTRWVDGQFALDRPELGLANWQGGRLLGRGGVLSGDGVHTVRLRAIQVDLDLHR